MYELVGAGEILNYGWHDHVGIKFPACTLCNLQTMNAEHLFVCPTLKGSQNLAALYWTAREKMKNM